MDSFFSPGRIGDSFRSYYKSAVDKIYGKECNELENSENVNESTPTDILSSDEEDDVTSPSTISFLSTPPEIQESDFRASYQELLVLDATSPGYVSRRVAEASRVGEFPAISLSLPTPPRKLHPVRLVGNRRKSIVDDAEGTSFASLSSLLGNRRESDSSQSPSSGATIDGGSNISPTTPMGTLSSPVLGSGLPTTQKQFKTNGGGNEDADNEEGEEVMDFVHFGGRGGGIAEMMRQQLSPGVIASARDRGNFSDGRDKLTMRRSDEARGWSGSSGGNGGSGGESVLEALRTLSRKRINLSCLLGNEEGGSEIVEAKRPKGVGWTNTQIIQMSSVQNKKPRRKSKVIEKRFPGVTGGSNEIQSSLSSSLGLRPPHLQVYLKRKKKFEEDANDGGGGRRSEDETGSREGKNESEEDEGNETGMKSNKKKKTEMEIESRGGAQHSFNKEDTNKDGGEERQSNISEEMGKIDQGNKEALKTIDKKKGNLKINESLQEPNSLMGLGHDEKVCSESVKDDVNKTKKRDDEDSNDEEDEPQLPPRKKTEIVEKVVTRPMVDALLKSAISKFVASGDIIQQAQRKPKEIQESKDEGDKAIKEGDSIGNQPLQLPETKEQTPIGGVTTIASVIPGGGNVISLALPQLQETIAPLPSIVPTTQGGSVPPPSENKPVGESILPGVLRMPEVPPPNILPGFPTSPVVERQSGGGSGGGILGFTFGSGKPLGESKEVKGSNNEAAKTSNVSGGFNFGGTTGFSFGGSPAIQPGVGATLLNITTTPITPTVKSKLTNSSAPSNGSFLFGSKAIMSAAGEASVPTCQPSGFSFGSTLGKTVTTVTTSSPAQTKQTPSLPFGFGTGTKPIVGGGSLPIGNPCTTAGSIVPVSPSPPMFAFGSSGSVPPSQQPPPQLPLPPSFKFIGGAMATPPTSPPSTGFSFANTVTTAPNPAPVPPLQTTPSSFVFGMGQPGTFGKGATTTTSGILSPSSASLTSPQPPSNPQFLFGGGTPGSIGGLGSKGGGGPGFTFGSVTTPAPQVTTTPSSFIFGGGGSGASGPTPTQPPSTSFTFGSSGGASRGGGFSFNIASSSPSPSSNPQHPPPPAPSSNLFGSPQPTVPSQQQPTSSFLTNSQALINKPSLPQQSFTFGSGASFGAAQAMPAPSSSSSSSSPALPSQPRVGSQSVFSFGNASQPTGQAKPPPQFSFEGNAPSATAVVPGGGFASPQINPLQGMQPMFSIGSGSTAPRTRPLRSRRPR